nr:PspC domain-containing protein [Enterococcus timonensis]
MNKKLTKSSTDKVLTGTLAGIGEYLGLDPTLIRIIYVILSFVGIGAPVILYILLAILIPQGPTRPPRPTNNRDFTDF